ncbi:hypothetical protein HGM15179_013380, partial [Zosterops borbonicus]
SEAWKKLQMRMRVEHPPGDGHGATKKGICLSETLLSLWKINSSGAGCGLGLCGLQHPLMVPALSP